MVFEAPNNVITILGVFCVELEFAGPSLIPFHFKGNNKSKSVSKKVAQVVSF